MPLFPRFFEEIYNTGKIFDSPTIPLGWDMTFAHLETILGGGAGSNAYSLELWGVGRIAPLSYFDNDSGAAVPVTGALAIRLPLATYYLSDHEGAIHKIALDAPLILSVEAGLDAAFVYLQAALVADSPNDWTIEIKQTASAPLPDLVKAGYPCVGQISSSSDAVTMVDAGAATVIFSAALVQNRLRALLGGGEEDGEEPVGGDSAAINLLKERVLSLEQSVEGLAAQIALLKRSHDLFPPPTDRIAEALGALAVGLGEVNPPAIERAQISVIGANFGHGQNDTEDFTPDVGGDLELPWNAELGAFGF